MPMILGERGNWKQWFLFTAQYCLMYVGIAAIFMRTFKWEFVFVGFVSGALFAFVPAHRRPRPMRREM
jgi:hypothetical protein